MAELQKLVRHPIPQYRDLRIRKSSSGEVEMIVSFAIGTETFQAVRGLSDKPTLVQTLKQLVEATIDQAVLDAGYQVI